MKSIRSLTGLRRPIVSLAGVALSMTALCALPIPSQALPQPNTNPQKKQPSNNTIAQKKQPQLNTIDRAIQSLQKSNKRWIQIKLSKQQLIAWQGNKPVYAIKVSTGKASTPTLPGTFEIQFKRRTYRMKGTDYDVPNVPYILYYDGNYAIHGAYWHRKFGTPVSHGCTNLAVDHAKWLFDWASEGTPVVINK
jgi:lipoprotein-anchoring transpeptidase ErfK/SrfK